MLALGRGASRTHHFKALYREDRNQNGRRLGCAAMVSVVHRG